MSFDFLRVRSRNEHDAEELMQEAFLRAYRKLHLFDGRAQFGTWLHRIAVNAVLGRIRKSKREQERLLTVADTAPPPAASA